jgi:hypothetical protein
MQRSGKAFQNEHEDEDEHEDDGCGLPVLAIGSASSNSLNFFPIGYWLSAIGYYHYENARVTPI